MANFYNIIEKIKISGHIELLTGMHIGASADFSPIGAVDSPVIRDAFTKEPIIPGSSLKGKLRTLLVRYYLKDGDYLKDIQNDPVIIKRMFGSSETDEIHLSRLIFSDCFFESKNKKIMEELDSDGILTETKFENTINRITCKANPRQIERVLKGSKFNFEIIYNVENIEEMDEDLKALSKGFEILEWDYLGGHGSRGYGKVKFSDITLSKLNVTENSVDMDDLQNYFG